MGTGRKIKSLPNGHRIHEFSFRHNLIREYIYTQLSKTVRELIHAEIGECLEQLYKPNTDEIASKLAIHFHHGHIADKTIHYSIKAAKDANRRYGASEAVRFCKMGMSALEEQFQPNACGENTYKETKLRFLIELAKAERYGGEPQEENDHIQVGISYLEKHLSLLIGVSESLCAEVYFQLGTLYKAKGSITSDKAKEFFEKALHIYEQHDQKENIAEILFQLGDVYPHISSSIGELSPAEKAIQSLEKSLSIAEYLQDKKLQSRCLSLLVFKYKHKDALYAEQCALQALELSKNLSNASDKFIVINALGAMAGVCRERATYKTGIQYLREALDITRQTGNVLLEAWILNDLGLDYGHYINLQKNSQKALQQSLLIRKRIGSETYILLSSFGRVLTRQGKWESAQECFKKAIEESTERQSLYHHYLGWLYMVREEYALAEKEFLYSLSILEKYHRSPSVQNYVGVALNYVLWGNDIQSKRYLTKAQRLLENETELRFKAENLYIIAEIYRILGELAIAKTTCQRSLEWYLTNAEDAEELVYVAEARLIMGKILINTGEYQEALFFLDKAKTAFEICGHYALGETLLYIGKAHQGVGGNIFLHQAKDYITNAIQEFQRLELYQKKREAKEVL